MNALINILAWVSFLVTGFYFSIVLFTIGLCMASKVKVTIRIRPIFLFTLALFVWPIVYFFSI
jgi:hypothetical protein